jgi:hypothetical protein
LKRSQSQSKAFLHGKDAFALAHIIVQIPLMEFQNLHIQFATSLRQRIVDGGLLTEVELDEALAVCEEIAKNPGTFVMSFIITQVWGRKPAY